MWSMQKHHGSFNSHASTQNVTGEDKCFSRKAELSENSFKFAPKMKMKANRSMFVFLCYHQSKRFDRKTHYLYWEAWPDPSNLTKKNKFLSAISAQHSIIDKPITKMWTFGFSCGSLAVYEWITNPLNHVSLENACKKFLFFVLEMQVHFFGVVLRKCKTLRCMFGTAKEQTSLAYR